MSILYVPNTVSIQDIVTHIAMVTGESLDKSIKHDSIKHGEAGELFYFISLRADGKFSIYAREYHDLSEDKSRDQLLIQFNEDDKFTYFKNKDIAISVLNKIIQRSHISEQYLRPEHSTEYFK